jgi:hypothetical protein
MMTIVILDNQGKNPPGKLADAELHFTDGPLAGLKLIGFGIWERRTGGGRNVTFPARSYAVNGERRSFALLRPISDALAQNRVRELILEAYAEYEQGQTHTAEPSCACNDCMQDRAAAMAAATRALIDPDLATHPGHDTGRKIETAGQQLGAGMTRALRF